MKKLRKIAILFMAFILFTNSPVTVHATNNTPQEETEESSSNGDILSNILENIKNADVSDEDVRKANEELTGDPNFNPLETAKTTLKRFAGILSNQDYDKDDFDGHADEVYSTISEGTEKVVDSGALDTLYNFTQSILNFFANIFSSAAKAIE